MLAPQFSLRKLIGFVSASGVGCLVVAAAVRGQLWAVAVFLAIAGLGALLVVHAILFILVTQLGRLYVWRKASRSVPRPSD
jgi:hypothetical protein